MKRKQLEKLAHRLPGISSGPFWSEFNDLKKGKK